MRRYLLLMLIVSATVAASPVRAATGVNVLAVADMNGDGLEDLLIRKGNQNHGSSISVVSAGRELWSISEGGAHWELGSVDGDRDGGSDVVVYETSGRPAADAGLEAQSITLRSGATGAAIWTLSAWIDDPLGIPGSSRFGFVEALYDKREPGDLLVAVEWESVRPSLSKGGLRYKTYHLSMCRIDAETGRRAALCIERDMDDFFFSHTQFKDLGGDVAILLNMWSPEGQRLEMRRLDGTVVWKRLASYDYYFAWLIPMPGVRPLMMSSGPCANFCGDNVHMVDASTGAELWADEGDFRPTGDVNGDGAGDLIHLLGENGDRTIRIASGWDLTALSTVTVSGSNVLLRELDADGYLDVIAIRNFAGIATAIGMDGRTLEERWRTTQNLGGQDLYRDASGNGTNDLYILRGPETNPIVTLLEADGFAPLWSAPYLGSVRGGNFAGDTRSEIVMQSGAVLKAYGPGGLIWSYYP